MGTTLVELFKKHKCYIAGGTITSLFCSRDINDIDVYFRDENSFIDFLYDLWDDQIWVLAHTRKATLFREHNKDIQLVHFSYFKEAKDIFDTFDFTVCMAAFDFADEQFVLHENFLQHNSQRILKFNKSTAFPLVSMLRVQKYKDKGYEISKPEFFRILLSCMDLEITSFEQLKEQLGGMYGVNYDKLIKFNEGEAFDYQKVIDAIENLCLHEDYFKKPELIKFDSVEDIIDSVKNEPVKYFKIKNDIYKISHNGTLRYLSYIPRTGEIIDANEYLSNLKLYKFVNKVNDQYFSFFDKNFSYKIGEEASATKDYLYFNELKEISDSPYRKSDKKALIEVKFNPEDFSEKNSNSITVKKCFVIREVPVGEYEKYLQ